MKLLSQLICRIHCPTRTRKSSAAERADLISYLVYNAGLGERDVYWIINDPSRTITVFDKYFYRPVPFDHRLMLVAQPDDRFHYYVWKHSRVIELTPKEFARYSKV